MNYEVFIKASARKQLRKIQDQDRERILERIVSLAQQPRPDGSLKLSNQEAYRIRQGDYRILYTIEDQKLVVEVIRIGHRRDIYRR